ncbi:hypothetical protein ABZY44_14925 [Streptomyces sp. NPDC006544]|uniref:hypothetical protein n=1 Tax=Streptomyces sp. NPDC006544 TaxID=3154583 RepID=UPI0033AB2C29
MAKQAKPSRPSDGEGVSRHKGTKQHGWSPDVDETEQQANPSAHRSFHPDTYAPAKGPGRTVSKEERGNPHGTPSKSVSSRGEDHAKGAGDDDVRDLGPRGRSQRPSGTKDASATTGVDPQDPPGTRSAG